MMNEKNTSISRFDFFLPNFNNRIVKRKAIKFEERFRLFSSGIFQDQFSWNVIKYFKWVLFLDLMYLKTKINLSTSKSRNEGYLFFQLEKNTICSSLILIIQNS